MIKKALDVAIEGNALFDAFQVTYNIFDQSLAQISSQLATQNKKVIVKEALANGRVLPNMRYPHYAQAYKKLQELATNYETGLDAIALRFCIDSIEPFKVLSGADNEAHLLANLRATQFDLEEKDIAALKGLAIPPEQYWKEREQLGCS